MLASAALRDLIEGPPQTGRLLGRSTDAAWAVAGRQAVVFVRPEAVRLPNSVVVDDLPADDEVKLGDGGVLLDGEHLVVSRWWDPRPVVSSVDVGALAPAVAELERRVEAAPDADLGRALARRSPVRVLASADELLGRGPGLTPSGDDLLVGALGAFTTLGAAADDPSVGLLIRSAGSAVLRLAVSKTTTLSTSLLRHALAGAVALPLARLIEAVAGQGSIDEGLDEVLLVGHSTGSALASGVLVGASALSGAWA